MTRKLFSVILLIGLWVLLPFASLRAEGLPEVNQALEQGGYDSVSSAVALDRLLSTWSLTDLKATPEEETAQGLDTDSVRVVRFEGSKGTQYYAADLEHGLPDIAPDIETALLFSAPKIYRKGYPLPDWSSRRFSSLFGSRKNPLTGEPDFHTGLDIPGDHGTAILAAMDGTVTQATCHETGYGCFVDLAHPDGTKTRYAHCSSLEVTPGQSVRCGEVIARMGTTGNSTGNHLHFEYMTAQGSIDPLVYIKQVREE